LTVFCLCHLHVHGEDSDVIIVGAGLAGLAAAEKLIYYGYSVTILEAQDRIGGRVKTEKEYFSNIAVDLGAQWVYGHINNTMADIVERVTGHHLVTKSDDARYYDNDIELESSDITEIKHMYSKLITKLEGMVTVSSVNSDIRSICKNALL
jgi:monoamine oxidase